MNTQQHSDLYQQINNHIGTRILGALRAYGISVRILSGNANQICQLIKVLEDPADPARVMGIENRGKFQDLMGEVIRHFHNFLASITTLVDHTRNLMREDFVKAQHRDEYQKKVSSVFADDPFTQFMQGFRDYICHYSIPIVGMSMTIVATSPNPGPKEIFVDLDHLEKKFKWTAPSRQFIESNKPSIRMLKLVDDYTQKVFRFHEEFGGAFQRYYEPEISEALALMQKW